MKLLGSNSGKFTINIAGAPLVPGDACPQHASLDDLKAVRQAQRAEQREASKRVFGNKTPAQDVAKKIETTRGDGTSLTDKLAADKDVRATRKRSPKPKPKTNGAPS